MVDIGPLRAGDRECFRGELDPATQAIVAFWDQRACLIFYLHPLRRKERSQVVQVGALGRG